MCHLNASQLSLSLSQSGHDTEEHGGHHKKCAREPLGAESTDRGACAGTLWKLHPDRSVFARDRRTMQRNNTIYPLPSHHQRKRLVPCVPPERGPGRKKKRRARGCSLCASGDKEAAASCHGPPPPTPYSPTPPRC
ncbi:hypothetical protein MHYP_G00221390 [Metynnis hypsauchen]